MSRLWFNQFRVGLWPNYFEACSSTADPRHSTSISAAMTPNTGPFDMNVVSDAVAAVFDKHRARHPVHAFAKRRSRLADRDQKHARSRPSLHSSRAATSSSPKANCRHHRKCVRYVAGRTGADAAVHGADADSDPHLLRRQHSGSAGGHARAGQLARTAEMARVWRDVVNKHGGDVTIVHLPEIGIKGTRTSHSRI